MRPLTVQPGYTEGDATALLASEAFAYAECYTITPLVGDAMRFTTAQHDISVVPVEGGPGRVTYLSKQVEIKGLRVRTNVGVEVDEQEIEMVYANLPVFSTLAMSMPQFLLHGRMDGATISRDRFIAAEWSEDPTVWVAGMPMFKGRASTMNTVGRMSAKMMVKSDLVLLDVDAPRDLFQPMCKNTWGDPNCGVNQDDFAVLGTLTGTPTRLLLPTSDVDSTFTGGKVHITNDDSVVRVRTILKASTSQIELIYPLDFLPSAAMEYTAYPQCGRLMENCVLYHGIDWAERFKGFPFVPIAETAL